MSWVTDSKNLGECANLNAGLADRWRIHDRVMREAAARFNLDYALVAAVAFVESKWEHAVVSGAGAEGLFQTMPKTGKWLSKLLRIEYTPYIPAASALMGALYLRNQINRYGYRLDLVLAAYNAGPGAVKKYGGVPPFKQTRAYIPAVKKAMVAIGQAEQRCLTGAGTVPQWGRARYGFGGSGSYPAPRRPSSPSSPSAPTNSTSSTTGGLFALVALAALVYVASEDQR